MTEPAPIAVGPAARPTEPPELAETTPHPGIQALTIDTHHGHLEVADTFPGEHTVAIWTNLVGAALSPADCRNLAAHPHRTRQPHRPSPLH